VRLQTAPTVCSRASQFASLTINAIWIAHGSWLADTITTRFTT
jgi:hypothetical protein